MDDDKSLVEKTIETLKNIASSVGDMAQKAADATAKAPAREPDAETVAEKTNEQVYMRLDVTV